MKNKNYKIGFVLQSAGCDTCLFSMQTIFKPRDDRQIYNLKEEIISMVQDLHNQTKPAACSGNLTIIYNNAVKGL